MNNAQRSPRQRGAGAVVAYLRRRGWPFEQLSGRTFALTRPTHNGSMECLAQVDAHIFVFRSLYPFLVPEGKRRRLAQFVLLANRHTPVGALDLDLEDGEIAFRTGLTISSGRLTPALVAAVVEPNLVTADRFLPGVAAVAFSDIAPQVAIEQCIGACSIAQVVALASELLESGEE